MNVSVLDRKMRGLCTHHLDADLDLDLIPGRNLYHPRQIGTRRIYQYLVGQILMARFDHDSQDHRVFHFPS